MDVLSGTNHYYDSVILVRSLKREFHSQVQTKRVSIQHKSLLLVLWDLQGLGPIDRLHQLISFILISMLGGRYQLKTCIQIVQGKKDCRFIDGNLVATTSFSSSL